MKIMINVLDVQELVKKGEEVQEYENFMTEKEGQDFWSSWMRKAWQVLLRKNSEDDVPFKGERTVTPLFPPACN